jgi:esterase/lipase superfamily enzyme
MANASFVAVRLQSEMGTRREWQRLERALSARDLDPRMVWETVRSAAVISQYCIEAGLRRQAAGTVINFGYLHSRLWGEPANATQSDSATLAALNQAIVTLAAFTSSSGSARAANDRDYVGGREALLARVDGLLGPQQQPNGFPLRRLLALGRSMARETGYSSLVHAARASRPWAALEELAAEARVSQPVPFAPIIERRESARLARDIRAVLHDDVPVAAIAWRHRQVLDRPHAPSEEAALDGAVAFDRAEYAGALAQKSFYEHREVPQAGPEDPALYRVWFGTDRERKHDTPTMGYGARRDPDGTLHLGVCDVHIPEGHKFGSVGPSWFERWTLRGSKSDRLKLVQVNAFEQPHEFADSIREALSGLDDAKTIFLYVHGYNTTFEGAAIRAAQMGFDLKINGVTALFSWPSRGRQLSYAADVREAEASQDTLEEFLHALIDDTEARTINLIIHSMGNKLVSESLRSLHSTLTRRGVKLGAMVLAAPDVDVTRFKQLARYYPQIAAQTTMYVSDRDRALKLSGRLWSGSRAGLLPPVTVCPDIDTIEVTPIDVSMLGHGYYAAAEPVLADIRAIFDGQHDPAKRLRIRAATRGSAKYWKFQA